MASAEHIKALLKSHIEGDDERFFAVGMKVAANEPRVGDGQARRGAARSGGRGQERTRTRRTDGAALYLPGRARGAPSSLTEASYPKSRLGEMILGNTLAEQIERVIREQRHAGRIIEQGLSPRSKLLLVGPPGTGKTMTTSVLARKLGLALLQVRLDGLITKYMGETAGRLRQVFDSTGRTRGVYSFDEFEAIGSQCGLTNDVGEKRPVLNSFPQMIEQERSDSLVVAATNHSEILDPALLRRFDDVLYYELPDAAQRLPTCCGDTLGSNRDPANRMEAPRVVSSGRALSHADISRAADEALKDTLIDSRSGRVIEAKISSKLEERRNIAAGIAINASPPTNLHEPRATGHSSRPQRRSQRRLEE